MTSTFFGLNTALTALQAQQMALNVTSHNVANANTDGYSRQDAVMTATTPFPLPIANRGSDVGQIGTGVQVAQIRRIRDEFLDGQIRSQTGALGYWATTSDYNQQVESVLPEPSDSGLSTLFGKMWGAWQDLSSDPSSYSAKAAVVQNATVLADVLNRDAGQLATLRTQAGQEVDIKLDDINCSLQKIADLNIQIQKVQLVGDQANDLTDQRDLLLDSLSKSLSVNYQEVVPTGSTAPQLQITLDGQTLVDGGTYSQLRSNISGGTMAIDVYDSTGTLTASDVSVTDSEVKGLQDVYNVQLNPSASLSDSYAARLNLLTSSLISQVNLIYDPSGVNKFFTSSPPSTSIEVNPALVNDPTDVRTGSSGTAGDGSIALGISKMQTNLTIDYNGDGTAETVGVDTNGDGTADSMMGDWYQQLITKLGIDGQHANAMQSNQQLLVDHLQQNKESTSGVSLDEEAANMVRFERAYQAAARTMTAMDEMLDKLINSTGLVGR
jgi:flagellar hook-associated protein 1